MGRYLALLVALAIGSWMAFTGQLLPESRPVGAPTVEFSAERAFADVSLLGAHPHPIGSPENARVREALLGRMAELGLDPQLRPGVGVQPSRRFGGWVAAGPVTNIVGVVPGRDRNAPAIGLMAHYDSVPGSPGAADDIMGVSAVLETVRAIKARGQPARDVMVIMTDGEEAGLLGANHFFRRDPLARRLGLVINVEARGSSGRVQMFQTSPNNGDLIRLFQQTAARPASSSLAVMIYERMPNDTDLTETLRAGLPGLNYAIIGRQFDYHSSTATPANLDRGSLQDVGTQVLAAAAEAAFSPQLPGRSPSLVYSNLFGDVVVAYPVWVGWVLLAGVAVLLAFSIRWARHSGEFPASDILRGMGALAFAGIGAVAVLQFGRRLTGAGFGFLEQRFLTAQAAPWEWAIMLLSLGFLMLAAGDMARGRRWMAAVPLTAGLACSAFGDLDLIGAVTGVVAALIGVFVYGKSATRKGAWAGVLLLGFIIALPLQAFAPEAAFVVVWPLLMGAIGAAATALSARPGTLNMTLLVVLAAAALGWQGGISHFAYEGMDLMPLFAIQMITAGFVLWPLAQPDNGARKGLLIGGLLITGGLLLTLEIRSNDPWSPRFPQVSYVGYLTDQDTGLAWRFALPAASNAWTDHVLRADGGSVERMTHFAWRGPMLAAASPRIETPRPTFSFAHGAAGGYVLTAVAPPGARTLQLQLRASSGGRIRAVSGAVEPIALPADKWVMLGWAGADQPLRLDLQPGAPGRLDVRYVATFDRWPAGVKPLPPRPSDIMPWDNSDGTAIAGRRAFAW